jgi:hypothetical protein
MVGCHGNGSARGLGRCVQVSHFSVVVPVLTCLKINAVEVRFVSGVIYFLKVG